ncbi:solute carrier family 35 (UDP-sugar transporter), member A1/2/3 [Nematocida displodere]|uniref:Solute carrier family 35 (UDP-sugar transporter), member A1/2/3 n=1 Tax=Nematocida displodere TaxID=1805483 RepID=A0A177EBJ5_9MICR|nr:solute carrier family 35 (UDP-sugar transporter), member A1/2/3 [Nematocida displodere]
MAKIKHWRLLGLSLANVVILYLLLFVTKTAGALTTTDKFAVTFLGESLKAVVCYLMMRWKEKKPFVYNKKYLLIGAFSSFQSFTALKATQVLPAILLQIIWQSRTFFVFLLSHLILNRKYSRMQVFSQVVLFVALMLPLCDEEISVFGVKALSATLAWAIVAATSCLSSAISSVYFEKIVKTSGTGMWEGSLNYSLSVALISGLGALASISSKTEIRNAPVVLTMSVLRCAEGVVIVNLVTIYSTLYRSLVSALCTGILSIPVAIQFEEKITGLGIASLGMIVVSLGLFNYGRIKG